MSGLPWGRAVVSSALSFQPTNERMKVTAENPEVEREVISWKVVVSFERCGPGGSKPHGFLFLVTTRGLCLSQLESVQQENCLPREGHHQKFAARCGVRGGRQKHPRLSKGAPEPLGPFDILAPQRHHICSLLCELAPQSGMRTLGLLVLTLPSLEKTKPRHWTKTSSADAVSTGLCWEVCY